MIDLHIHTNHSDGEFSVKEILQKAEEEKLEVISITDHDAISAYDELEKMNYKNYFNGKIIYGSEIKCICDGKPIEILAYNFEKEILKSIQSLNINMAEKQEKYLQYLVKKGKTIGINIDVHIGKNKNEYASFVYEREIRKNPQYIEVLKKNKIELNPNFYRTAQTNPDTIFYIDEKKDFTHAKELIKQIHNAKGLAFLAHPYIYGYKNIFNIIYELKQYGLDGIECYYSTNTDEQTKEIIKKTEELNLLKSGGTDFHGSSKPDIKLGIGKGNLKISKNIVNEWNLNKVLM